MQRPLIILSTFNYTLILSLIFFITNNWLIKETTVLFLTLLENMFFSRNRWIELYKTTKNNKR